MKSLELFFILFILSWSPLNNPYDFKMLDSANYSDMYWNSGNFSTKWGQISSYGLESRMFVWKDSIYINKDAYWMSEYDFYTTVLHEKKHVDEPNIEHSFLGIMSPFPIVRILTTYEY